MNSAKVAGIGLCISVSLLTGCGGGGSSDGTPPPAISVSVSLGSAAVPASTAQQFNATVRNDPNNRGVAWSLQGTACNGGPCGTLDNSNANPVTYYAPTYVPDPPTEMLVATALVDSTVWTIPHNQRI